MFVIVIQESPKPLSLGVFRPSRFSLKAKKNWEINFPGLILHSWNAEIKTTLIVASAGKKRNQRRVGKRKVRTNHLLIIFASSMRLTINPPYHILLLVDQWVGGHVGGMSLETKSSALVANHFLGWIPFLPPIAFTLSRATSPI
jgi:hypothetical protein